ncbi:unnamed protein product, partial [Nesidiocoris tenuis]
MNRPITAKESIGNRIGPRSVGNHPIQIQKADGRDIRLPGSAQGWASLDIEAEDEQG